MKSLFALLEFNKALSSTPDLKNAISNIFNILSFRLAMSQGFLTILDSETKKLITKVLYGPDENGQKAKDIQERVFERGQPAAIPHFDAHPLFLDGSSALNVKKPDISYLCVPIKIKDRVIGVLTVDRLLDENVAFHEDLELLKSISSFVANTIETFNSFQKEREDLIEENRRLNRELKNIKTHREKDRNGDELKKRCPKRLTLENVLEKKLFEIVTVMDVKTEGKRRLYADTISQVEKALIKLALERTKNVKYEAARFLGINRNTLHKKMNDLDISI